MKVDSGVYDSECAHIGVLFSNELHSIGVYGHQFYRRASTALSLLRTVSASSDNAGLPTPPLTFWIDCSHLDVPIIRLLQNDIAREHDADFVLGLQRAVGKLRIARREYDRAATRFRVSS